MYVRGYQHMFHLATVKLVEILIIMNQGANIGSKTGKTAFPGVEWWMEITPKLLFDKAMNF